MQMPYRLSVCGILLILAACSRSPKPEEGKPQASAAASAAPAAAQKHADKDKDDDDKPTERKGGEEKDGKDADFVKLSDKQILAAHIEVAAVRTGFAGAVEAPAVIIADPQHAAVVSSSVSGRVISVRKNLGENVARGDILAVIESREVAQFSADVALARRQLELADAGFKREDRLYAEKVSSRQEYELARSALDDARTRLRLAQQQLATSGGAEHSAQLTLRAPVAGVVTARQVALGDIVEANAKLFELANPDLLSVELSLAPSDASRVAPGTPIEVSADGRSGTGHVAFLSRVLDPATRQIRAIATLPNKNALWRIGETVSASVVLKPESSGEQIAVPRSAVQTVEDKPSVFVRQKDGFAIKHIVLGKPAAGFVTVLSGLDGSERIATSNTFVIKAEHGKGEAGGDND
ncbi:efflux RND transporter periplasmic adaptor subunit [Duganella sp. FT80W]|uniref:Efflux RND transporter periplasmic adaptor subunit n=1 Tax=Duganella guangzhouensis TaxID=2666084 RepID=A0A6I2L2D4_9BURK|nr:efflux RND transporter periplasmic adaptor subunit [Duganella guangzhouensis]MRW91840.1 efflux RND transporter periplasmic adaptor subunit [Duganella guangzhouensis]